MARKLTLHLIKGAEITLAKINATFKLTRIFQIRANFMKR